MCHWMKLPRIQLCSSDNFEIWKVNSLSGLYNFEGNSANTKIIANYMSWTVHIKWISNHVFKTETYTVQPILKEIAINIKWILIYNVIKRFNVIKSRKDTKISEF